MNKIKTIPARIFILLLVLALVAVVLAYSRTLINQIYAYKLLPQPERFTELYFANHQNLPTVILVNQEQSFQFTIHNLEYTAMSYTVEVSINYNNKKVTLDKQAVFLKNDQYKTITEKFSVSQPATKAEVIVNLPTKNEQIDFWVKVSE